MSYALKLWVFKQIITKAALSDKGLQAIIFLGDDLDMESKWALIKLCFVTAVTASFLPAIKACTTSKLPKTVLIFPKAIKS